jgi:hypothetical protein
VSSVANEPRYPPIAPVVTTAERPFWSIMIPSYNCAEYLRATLRSVLEQIPAGRAVQIEVVDDCSTRDDPAGVVAECHDSRVAFYRQPANVGPQANFTTCIERAYGEWVHILHGDDLVAPGFYDTLERALRAQPAVGAAFCRTINIDAAGHRIDLSDLEADTAGILPDLIERLGVRNLIMFPSIVVKRATTNSGRIPSPPVSCGRLGHVETRRARRAGVVRAGTAGDVPTASAIGHVGADAQRRQYRRRAKRHRGGSRLSPDGDQRRPHPEGESSITACMPSRWLSR